MIYANDSSISSEEMLRMQQDAISRVREMQKRAGDRIKATNQSEIMQQKQPVPVSPPGFQMPVNNNMNNRNNHSSPIQSLLGGNFSDIANIPKKALSSVSSALESLGLDNDRLLIIILILILASDEGDKTLILALAYLLF